MNDPIERGMAEAFGDDEPSPPASVLGALRARTDLSLGVHLDSQTPDEAPVEVTEAAKALRDPSGRYQVLGEIGRGGVGVVYKGRDTDLGRDVAMKVLRDEYAARPDVLARFVEEAQIGGQLQHPGIVPVYELGLQAGERPYFAMKLVKGETLAEQLARRASPSEDRRRLLGVFEQVCQTVAYAHARRVIHRDLKPANVMIGAFGEVQVVDWGFAKVLAKGGTADEAESARAASERSVIETVRSAADSGSHSLPGSMMGTPAYMPPEQAQGDIARLDRRSDVFALGAVLCELLTGQPPYREQDGDLGRQAANAELDGAHRRLRSCGADEPLIELCLECLAPARRARPESAAEVAERVGAWLTSVEERARQAELRAAEARYKARTTRVISAAGLAVVLLGAGAWIWMQDQAQTRRADATQRVAMAMSAASGAHGKAQAAGLDPAQWDLAFSSAEQAATLARSDDVDDETREEAVALLATVETAREAAAAEAARRARDETMLARLEALLIPAGDDLGRGHHWQWRASRRLDADYSAAFSSYLEGLSLIESPIERVVASLRRGDIDLQLSAALDHWSLVRDRQPNAPDAPSVQGTARLREIASRLDPEDPWRTELRGLLPDAEREGERLESLLKHLDPGAVGPSGYRVLGQALCRAGRMEAVVSVLRQGQERFPQDVALCIDLALHLELLDEPELEEALATYRIARALRPKNAGVLHRQGLLSSTLGRHADAQRAFRRLVAVDPLNPHALQHVGMELARQGESERALDHFERMLELDPGSSMAHKMIGGVRVEQGQLEDAIENYERAVELDPEDALHHYNLGTTLHESGRLEDAVESLQRAVELAPRDERVLLNLGNALSDLERLDDAVEAFERALVLDARYARAQYNLANTLRRQGLLEEALAGFDRAIELDPLNAAAHSNRGAVLGALARFNEAVGSYDRAIELAPTFVEPHHNRGYAFERTGRITEAAAAYRAALEIDPGFGPSRRRLARLEQEEVLDEVLAGEREADSAAQWDAAVLFGYEQQRLAEVVALAEATLAAAPELLEGQEWGLYNPACAAALLACETTNDERSRLRALARAWLAREVERWKEWRAEEGGDGHEATRRLRHALRDPDFASVRDDPLAELPQAEGVAWRELWSSIAAILRQDER